MELTSSKSYKYSFWLTAILLLIQQLRMLFGFSFRFVGSDQTVLWQMANDIGKGILPVPYFYGQNYNFPLESWLAIPLLKMGTPYEIAFPIITIILFTLPFLLLSRYFFKNENKIAALFCLGILLIVPQEFNLISGLSRGFVTGIFTAGFIPLFINKSTNLNYFLVSFFAAFALVLNANSIIFFAPVVTYFGLLNIKKFNFYLFSFLGLLIPFGLKYKADQYYVNHPDYMVSQMWGDNFHWPTFLEGVSNLSHLFQFSIPLFWSLEFIIIPMLIVIIFLLFKKKNNYKAISIIGTFLIILIAVGMPKVHDDIGTIFLNTTRMWLGIPLLICICLGWILENYNLDKYLSKIQITILIIFLGFFTFKQVTFDEFIKKETKPKTFGAVSVIKINDLRNDCFHIKDLAQKNNVELVAMVYDWSFKVSQLEFYAYGCPLLESNFPKTLMNRYEKRKCRKNEEMYLQHQNILIVGWNDQEYEKHKHLEIVEKINDTPRIFLVHSNGLDIKTTFDSLKIRYKAPQL